MIKEKVKIRDCSFKGAFVRLLIFFFSILIVGILDFILIVYINNHITAYTIRLIILILDVIISILLISIIFSSLCSVYLDILLFMRMRRKLRGYPYVVVSRPKGKIILECVREKKGKPSEDVIYSLKIPLEGIKVNYNGRRTYAIFYVSRKLLVMPNHFR